VKKSQGVTTLVRGGREVTRDHLLVRQMNRSDAPLRLVRGASMNVGCVNPAPKPTRSFPDMFPDATASTLRLRFTRARHRAHRPTPPTRVCGWPGASSLGGAA
jgi:hypothetical protein